MTLVATWPLKTMMGMESNLRRGQWRDGVGRRRPAGDDANPRLAGRPGIPIGAMSAALFVAVQNEFGRRLIKLIEDRQDGSAGISEHDFHLVLLRSSISWKICAPDLPLYLGLESAVVEAAFASV